MAADSPAPHEPDQPPQQVEALIDELILEILDHADQGQPARRSALPGGMLDGVRAGMSRGGSGSTLERLLLAETLAGVLADALAPALAEALAPRIMKALEAPGEQDQPAPSKAPAGRSHARKSESK